MASSEHIKYAALDSNEVPIVKHHPLSLGYYVSVAILKYLPLVDVIRFERVSSDWRTFMREWLESPEARLNFLTPWSLVTSKMDCNPLSYAEARRIIAIRHRLQTGQAASYSHLKNVDDLGDSCKLSSRGGLLAWRRAGKQAPLDSFKDAPSWIPSSKRSEPDTVICRRVSQQAEEELGHEPTSRPTICLRRTEGMRGEVKRLRMNSEGVLLIIVACPPLSHKESRLIVYSTTEHRTLWQFPNDWPLKRDWGCLIPLEIGREFIYCAAPLVKNEWTLSAVNFRTGEKVYGVSSLCLHTHPGDPNNISICSCDFPDITRSWKMVRDLSRLVSTRSGGEFLVRSWTRLPTQEELMKGNKLYLPRQNLHLHNLNIIRGSDGNAIQSLIPHWVGASDVIVDPVSDQLVIVWNNVCTQEITCAYWQDTLHTSTYSATVILPVDLKAGPGRRISDAVVFLYPYAGNGPLSLVHPFAMTQLDPMYDPSPNTSGRRDLLVHTPFRQTTDRVLLEAADKIIRSLFLGDTPLVGHCYETDYRESRSGTRYSGDPKPDSVADWNNTCDWEVSTRTQLRFVGDSHERLVVPTERSDRLCFDYI
ncbi:hypothetical protein BJX65DRAFT_313522 [Aspergillus insuetus]